jgi:ribosome maturation protein Sdo1
LDKAKKLIEILLDPNADDAERDDAAIDLGDVINSEEVIKVLLKVANDLSIEEMVRASCGESLAHIWLSRGNLEVSKLANLKDVAFSEAVALIKKHNIELYNEFRKMYPGLITD